MVDELLEQSFRVPVSGFAREQDVAASALRKANQVHVDELVVDVIAAPHKFRLRRLEHTAMVIAYGGYVLDAKHMRFEDSRCARDLRVQRVARVGVSGVVVEVGVALARWSGQSELNLANL